MSQVIISTNDLAATVNRHLSIIGKRSVDDKGNLLFKDITLGTNEKEIINDYFQQAIIDLSAETAAFIYSSLDNSITLEFKSHIDTAILPFIKKSCESYCTSFALYSWLFITAPRIASQYLDDCQRQLRAVIRLIHQKKEPSNDRNTNYISDVTTTIETS